MLITFLFLMRVIIIIDALQFKTEKKYIKAMVSVTQVLSLPIIQNILTGTLPVLNAQNMMTC